MTTPRLPPCVSCLGVDCSIVAMPTSRPTPLSRRLGAIVVTIVVLLTDTLHSSIVDDAPYQTLQFTPNITHRTDLCDRQQLLRVGTIEFKDVLRGIDLSVGLGYLSDGTGNTIYDDEAGDFAASPGFHISILDEVARRAGFSWRDSYGLIMPPYMNDSFRLQPNASVDDLLLWAVNTYDFTFTEWDRTIERMKLGIDFPTGFTDTSTILIADNSDVDKRTFNPFSFLQPFNIFVWLAIILTIALTAFVYRSLKKIYNANEGASRESNSPKG